MTKNSPTTGEQILARVSSVVLFRHAKAPSTGPEQKDWDRKINDVGTGQAKKLAAKLEGAVFDTILSSPVPRVVETVEIATGNTQVITLIGNFTCPTDGIHPIDVMANTPGYGYASMAKYLEHELAEHLIIWGLEAATAFANTLPDKPNQTVLVGGHAVLQPAVAWGIIEMLRESGVAIPAEVEQLILNVNLKECEALKLSLNEGKITCEYLMLD